MTNENPEVSVVLPCRNEEKTIASCIASIKDIFEENRIDGEVIVSDSSSDRSPIIAQELGARVVKHNKEGYGVALLEGFALARGNYIFFADPDGTYDFREIPRFLAPLYNGYDLVIGNRFKGKIARDAMPWLHRYIGNPLLSLTLRILFNARLHDAHCGMRALTKDALANLNPQTTGMEFASEIIVKAVKNKLKIKELPINYYQRKGDSKLQSFADGWRHLRFMLLYSPLFLFFIPGLTLFLLGLISMVWLYSMSPTILGIKLFYHPMFLSSLLVITGYQIMIFSLFAKTYAITHLSEENPEISSLYEYITIEKASILGIIISLFGMVIYVTIFFKWIGSGFGALEEIKNSIVALTLVVIGIQTIFSSFILSILGIKEKWT